MKRHRKTTLNKQMALLSATEFASLLNQHDDASAVLSALQRFVFTVKRERRIALGVHHGKYEGGSVDLSADEGGSDLSSSSSDESERDSGDNEEVPMKAASPRKRFKIDEAWKEDSAFYQVPFVGTAVAASKKTDVVVVGEWPTGILQAYLTKSPLAVELISDNLIPSSSSSALHKPLLKQRSSKKEQQKNRRLSQAIHKAYLRALAELVTAAIPMEKWLKKTHAANRTNSRNQEQQTRFISELVTKRLVMLLSVLAEETGHGKGKSGLRGGCGPLAAPLLTIIDRLAMTSTQTARHIARSLEQNLPETVLRFLLSHRPRAHQQQQKGEDESRSLPTETPREKAQIAALNLASTLTEIDDAVVFSCISTAGVKDKKVRPGALFLALQQGLPVQQQHQTDAVVSLRQIQAVTRLFKAVRSLLSRPAVSQRSLIVIFSRECMQHICHISTSWAPPLTNFEVVLSVTDTHDDTEHAVHDTYDMEHAAHATLAKEKAGTEARRLLFPLLADLKRSPFLPSISAATKHNRFYEAAVQRVTRAMVLLLDDRNLEVRRFLLHIPSIAPVLLPAFFRAMPIPDTRQPFAFAARLSCVSAFLRQGPRAADCFSITEIADEGKLRVDSVLLTMLPLGLKKHTFAKALQSTNHFVALEALKLLVVAFGRCRCFLLDLDKRYDKNLVARVSDLLTNELPDLLILLATLAKLDVQRDRKSGVVLFGYACEAVRTCISVFPVKDGKFDWTKLLPGNAMAFHSSPVLVQRMILSSVKVAILSQKLQSLSILQFNSYKIIVEIALTARSEGIYREARAIAIDWLSRTSARREGGAEYEAACWVDGVTLATLDEHCSFLQESTTLASTIFIDLSHAWRKIGLPAPVPKSQVSTILVWALRSLSRASNALGFLIVQVATKCLIRDLDPLPFAVLIIDAVETEHTASTYFIGHLKEYAQSIVYFDRYSGANRAALATRLLKVCFSSDSYPLTLLASNSHAVRSPGNRFHLMYDGDDCLSLNRQMIHLAAAFEDDGRVRCDYVVQHLLPVTIVTSGDVTAISEQLQAVTTRYLSEDGVSTDCLLLSSGRYSTVGTQHKTRDTVALICNASDSFNYGMGGEVRFSILYLYVIGTFLPVASLIGSLGRMLEQYGEESFEVRENPFCRLTSTFLMLSIRNMHLCADGTLAGVKFTAILLRAWLSLTANCVGQSFYIELVARVEDLLCLNLANSPASLALLEHESALLVERCLKTKLMNIDKSDHKPQGCLLASIVASDPLKFSPALLRSLVEKNLNNSFRHLFDRGLLDRAVCMMLDCPEFVKGHLEKVLSLSSLLNARAMKMISVSLYPNLLLDGLLSVLLAYTSHVIILKRKLPLPSVVELLTRNVDQLPAALQRVLDLEPVLTKEKLLKLTLRICLANHQDGNSSVKTLVSSLLLFLCEELPQSLRVSVDTKTSGPTNFIDPLNLISWLRDLLLGCCDYDIVSRVSLKVTSLIRVFLKIGIGTTHESNTNIRLACLELVSHYMVHLHDGSAELRPFVSSFSPSLASQVFLMVTTHSKFVSLMNSSEEDAVKLEALRILLGCLSATDDIEFDADVWSCFLASFNAGTTEIDLVLRCLLSLYARKSPKDLHFMFLDQLRWGEASRREQSNNPWEWLVDSIELGRVYATIECFPIHDFLNLGHMDKAKGCTYKGIEHHVYTKVSSSDRNGDQRYSPGFLLPLVLGALEEEADRMNFLSNGSVSHSFVCDSSKVKGVLVAQRLCEKGALALALASLASQCSSLRKLSIAIIGHIAGAVDSQYAHQTASWRERPQIAMLLNAVQRSLVVRYAEAQGSMEESSPIEVPELPGFSAIFLARASLILARPSDPLFLDINRCFLRTEIDGGGFQDLTRLPAFMSLFCSSSDCTDQLACERNFALDLVKDGFTNDDSYKLLMACHCPELLLTSIESARARSLIGVEDELPLLFTTLSKLVSTGGERVASHLINRMGLLSWLRSLLLGNVSFFKMSSRVTFLKLLSVVTRRTVDLIPCDEFTAATAGLPQAVLSLALECVDGPDLVQTLPASMTVCICQMLATFSSVKITEGTDGHSQCNRLLRCQSDGVQLELAIQFISILNSHEQQRSALLSVCLLPAMFYPEDSSLAKAFCIMVLKSSMTMDDCTAEFKLVVLRRVSMLSGVLCHAWLDREPILRKLMAWRRECAHETQSREAWHTCVEALVCDEEKQSKAPLSDASNEAELASWVLRNEKHSSVGFADGSMN